MRRVRRASLVVVLGLLGMAVILLYGYARSHPEDMPWTPLDLGQPVGAFTGRKLADLADEGELCRALLDQAGIAFSRLPARSASAGQCGYRDAVRFAAGGALQIDYRPADLGTNCAVAAGLALWEWHVVQPAALRHFGQPISTIEHLGSYSCRRIYGRSEGAWSEHATANAVDIAGFRLADGTRIIVVEDWAGSDAHARFLRDVRDGACDLFATVLSPDYNEAHRDHLHLDQAQRGSFGWRGCR
ncbi:MAG TPA: extensin family protein [Allosphingosinicella sp.]|nr:extensin family protein [Allosphingosinicella sp.]